MRHLTVLSGLLLSAFAFAQTDAAGHWQGSIQIPNHELPITVDIAKAGGEWIGSITVSGSSAVDVPLHFVTMKDREVRFTANLPERTSFDAHLSLDRTEISGAASSSAGEADLVLKRKGEPNVRLPRPSTPISKDFEGTWEGALQSSGHRVGLKLSAGPGGLGSATLIAIDQGKMEIPASTVIANGKQLEVEVRSISGAYSGTLGSDEIAGTWTEGGQKIALTLKRVSQ